MNENLFGDGKHNGINSVAIPEGFVMIGFTKDNFSGDGFFYRPGIYHLNEKSDSLTNPESLIIRKNTTEEYNKKKNTAIEVINTLKKIKDKKKLDIGHYNKSELNSHRIFDKFDSIIINTGYEVIIFEDDDFSGKATFLKSVNTYLKI